MASAAQVTPNTAKYGFYSRQAVLLTDDDHLEFQALTESYQSELRPQTAIQETLFTQIILALWNLRRSNRLEASLALSQGVDPLLSTSKILDRIHTFRNRTERSYSKLLKEFRLLKSAKQILQNEPNQQGQTSPLNNAAIKPVGGQAPWPADWRPRQPLQNPKTIQGNPHELTSSS